MWINVNKVFGILAHVDAGKTTFTEQILLAAGAIRAAGRVDHRDTFLDLHPIERERGITVFSDQAAFDYNGNHYSWLDTPGHTDFIAEMERVLPVLDFAALLVSAPDGVQSHTETVWNLLREYNVPTLIFVNKTDRADGDFDACLAEMRQRFSPDVCDLRGFTPTEMDESVIEAAAERDEALFERLMDGEYSFNVWLESLQGMICERRLFPVFSGSALRGDGIREFLAAMDTLTPTDFDSKRGLPFSGRVYRIRYDVQGARCVYFKAETGVLRVKDEIETPAGSRKINDLRLRNGGRSVAVHEIHAGETAFTSLSDVRIGDALGAGSSAHIAPRSEPMLEASVTAKNLTKPRLMEILRILEDEEPTLRVTCDPRTGEPALRVMGGIQIEILQRIAADRFGASLEFGPPRILYMETIRRPAVGIGHYEPLRHYAEVWLRLVPTNPGSGITFVSRCHVDDLALNWQRLIETHVFEREYPGVLVGAPLTDVRVELIAGRSHPKHTEGGDFREATCRALRNALMYAENVLLEPIVALDLTFPTDLYGRVMGDLNRMRADTQPPLTQGDVTRVHGTCAYRAFADYPEAFRAATHGRGALSMRLSHYAPVDEPDALIEASHYNPLESDTPDSVFCSHGAGHIVRWDEVRAAAHCDVPDALY